MDHVTRVPPLRYAPHVTHSLKRRSTYHSSSGFAATQALPYPLLRSSTTKSNLTSISDLLMNAYGLSRVPLLPPPASRLPHAKATSAYQQSLVAASLYVDYIFLDTDERRRMAQNPHEYLIEQLQFTGDESVGSSSNKIKLNFNHPCKELVWVVQPDANVDYCASLECGSEDLAGLYGAQPFNYTDCS